MVGKKEQQMLGIMKDLESRIGRMIPYDTLYSSCAYVLNSDKAIKDALKKLINKEKIYVPREGFYSLNKKVEITKDTIEANFIICKIEHRGIDEPSAIFCTKIEYMHDIDKNDKMFDFVFDHHLMFWNNDLLVFKVWLPNGEKDKEFKDVFEAMESVGIKCNARRENEN